MAVHTHLGLSATDARLWNLDAPASMLDALRRIRQELAAERVDQDQLTFWTLINPDAGRFPADALQVAATGVDIERREVGSTSMLRIDTRADDPFVLSLWPQPNGIVHLVATVPASDGRWQRVERWVARSSRALVPCYLNEEDFLGVGEALGSVGDVEVSKLTWRDGLQSHAVGYRANRPTLAEAVFRDVPGTGQVRTALLRAGELSIHLRRLAGATFYNGDLRQFADIVVAQLDAAAARRMQLLVNRERAMGRISKPLSVRLPQPMLRTPEDTGEVIRLLGDERRLALAVVHRNPYLHLTVTDYDDGSNFDVFVTAPDEISVHPGFRATVGSLNFLLQRLTEGLQGSSVGERESITGPSKQDLLIAH